MQEFQNTLTLIIELLLIASIVAIVVRRLRIPYTVALVVVGLLLTTQSPLEIELTPELILALFVPPLIFEAAFYLNFNEFRRSLTSIIILAVPGVIMTTLLVGGMVSLGTSLSLPVALVFGAMIAATDPVAVVAIVRRLRVPTRLAVLLEGESLLNDGTALVLFNLMLTVALTSSFDLAESVFDFLRVSIGGLAIGLLLGWIISRLITRIDDHLIEITLTTVLAYGSYLVAEQFHFSGVLAVVAAGLVNGNMGQQGMSPTARIVLFNFWEYVAFLVNSLVFMLIGLEVDIPTLLSVWQPIAWAVAAVVIVRILVVYGLSWIANRFSEPVSLRWQHILAWGGLRGALSLAMALSLPIVLGTDRDLMRTMTFGVVLFTLLVQATTIRPLIRRLGIITWDKAQIEYETRHAHLTALRAAENHLERRYREGLISSHAWETLRPKLQEQNALLAEAVRETLQATPTLEAEELDTARREILRAQRSAFIGLRQDGIISDEVFEKLTAEVDAVLEEGSGLFWFVPGTSLPRRIIEEKSSIDVREIQVEANSACAGKRIREISWPQDFIIANLRRGDELIIPRGDTVMEVADILMVVADDHAFLETQSLCKSTLKTIKPG